MNGPLHHNETYKEARRLFRSFSFDLKSQMSPTSPSAQLAQVVVKASDREDQRERELAEWRKYFEPWPISE